MQKLRKISKEYYLRQVMACWLVFCMMFIIPASTAVAISPLPDPDLSAGPYGFAVGSGEINQGGLETHVKVQSQESIIHWNSIDTRPGELLDFYQEGVTGAAVLNRVTSGIDTKFFGDLTAEAGMKIFMINPAGIVFGQNATINVSQLVASSLDIITNEDFLNGMPYEFTDGATAGNIIFNARSNNVIAERLYLIGKNVRNKGGLVASDFVVMAAGDKVTISEPGSAVVVDIDWTDVNPADYDQFKVENRAHVLGENTFDGDFGPQVGDVPTSIEAEHIILAAGDIWSAALVKAYSNGGSNAVATVDIDAIGNVEISEAVTATAEADDGEFGAIARIDIEAGGNVELIEDGQLIAHAETMSGPADAAATVSINAEGDVHINQLNNNDDTGIEAGAAVYCMGTGNAEATVGVSGENVTLDGQHSNINAWAETGSEAGDATAIVNLAGDGDVISVDSGDITVEASTGGGSGNADAALNIIAAGEGDADGDVIIGQLGDFWVNASTNNETSETSAAVDIDAADDVEVIGGPSDTDGILAEASGGQDNKAEIGIVAGGDLLLESVNGNETWIKAFANDGGINNADVLICTVGSVEVISRGGSLASIEATVEDGFTNIANVGIGAREGVVVSAGGSGSKAGISSKAKEGYGYTNTASTIVCTQGGIEVLALSGGAAGIFAQAKDGFMTDAYVGVCAVDDVIVHTGNIREPGSDALIRAEAEMGDIQVQQNPREEPVRSTADAEVTAVSHLGNVGVTAYNGGHAGIEAEAQGAHMNTASVGVAAGADLSPQDVAIPDYPNGDKILLDIEDFDIMPITGNVIVEAFGEGSEAQILANAHDAYPVYVPGDIDPVPGENTADTVVCAPGWVEVYADQGSEARIKSQAGWGGDDGAINEASTQVYASEVKVNVSSLYPGQGIWAYAFGDGKNPRVGPYYCLTGDGDGDGAVAITDGEAVLIIQDYSSRQDCPDCPPCPCEEEQEDLLAPVAPLWQLEIPRVEGCPVLTQAAAMELGIAGETLQVAIGNALAVNPNIQPCQACETLVNAANTLRDQDGSRMAAMVQTFNTLAPANAPFTPEMATSIAMVFEGAAEGSQYASAIEYIDAFVQYVAVLDIELGSPVGDSVAFVMDKYGAGIAGSDNGNIAAFVATRLEAIGM